MALALVLPLMACTPGTVPDLSATHRPAMGWDHRPEGGDWTARTLMAVAEEDAILASRIPADIAQWCPGYETASVPERRAFWVGLLSAVAKYESSWNPKASGGGGKYIGVMQISPRSAANYDCDAQSSSALKDGAANLACAVEMVSQNVERDGVVAGKGNRGIGRDWMPFRKGEKRAAMAEWTRSQAYCR